MPKREFLMLAHDHENQNIGGWWWSEKLDGCRAFWDSGVSRGLPSADVPWANTKKDARLLDTQVSTGLWSRYGKVVHAPDWWLDALPKTPLDLELHMGRGKHQQLRSCIATHVPDARWEDVVGAVIDAPSLRQVFADGDINNANWQTSFYSRVLYAWLEARGASLGGEDAFRDVYKMLGGLKFPDWVRVLEQVPLPDDAYEADRVVRDRLAEVTHASPAGEGLIVRDPRGVWVPKRTRDLLKVKPEKDAEGTVTGFTWGRETDKGSRHLGRMGALILRLEPGEPPGAPMTTRRLELSGFSDEERAVKAPEGHTGHLVRQGEDAIEGDGECVHFQIGSRVTFTYRELTDAGICKEARYLRPRGDS